MDNNKTFEQKLEMAKNRKTLTIDGVPVPLFQQFKQDVKTHYNNSYWAKLQDIMRKAELYDMFVLLGYAPQSEEGVQDTVEEDNSVYTLTGKIN